MVFRITINSTGTARAIVVEREKATVMETETVMETVMATEPPDEETARITIR
jgi:hypothetical protein